MKKAPDELDDILKSLDGIERAAANPFLFEKIKHRMEARRRPRDLRLALKWATVLGAVVILNVLTWTKVISTSDQINPAESIASELGFANTSYQY